jgi:sugar O-acyltransferase (sialic acid O-acetyltransferase NeuD family)
MSGLLLVAAGGLAREVLVAVRASRAFVGDLRVLDDAPQTWGGELNGVPVAGGLEEVKRYEGHEVVVCAGRGTVRRDLVARLSELGVTPERYATVVHPSVQVPPSCEVGRGSVLLAGVALTADVHVGDHVVAMPNVTLTHDDHVSDYATLCSGVSLGGTVRVGTAAYLGMNAAVREGLSLGEESVLGMGSVLLADLPAAETWAGVPARLLTRTASASGSVPTASQERTA